MQGTPLGGILPWRWRRPLHCTAVAPPASAAAWVGRLRRPMGRPGPHGAPGPAIARYQRSTGRSPDCHPPA
eukprot:1383882-Lingulodinium_polyedra.AAC.1